MTLLLTMLLSPAIAGPCELASDGMPVGPIVASFDDGAFGTPRRICPRSEIAAGMDARLTVDTDNFYGLIIGGLVLDGSWAVRSDTELYARLEAVRFDLAIASTSASALGLGHLTLGATHLMPVNDTFAVGLQSQLVLPTATGLYRNAYPFGVELALASTWAPNHWFRLHDSMRLRASAAASAGPAAAKAGGAMNMGIELRPAQAFAVVFDADLSMGHDAPLDHLSGGLGLRFSDGKRFGFEIGARVPLLGRERALAAIGIRGSARLGR